MGELSISIGQRLRKLRKANKMTQAELAEKANLSPITVRRYEKAERDLPMETWVKLAGILGVSAKDAEAWYLSDMGDDFQALKATVQTENRLTQKGIELLSIYLDLTEEGQKKVLAYARDIQKGYGGVSNGQR